MSRDGSTSALPQQGKAAVEQRGDACNAVSADLAGREFDRECDAVQLRADIHDERRLVVIELELVEAGRYPLDEQLGSGIAKDIGRFQSHASGRAIERK